MIKNIFWVLCWTYVYTGFISLFVSLFMYEDPANAPVSLIQAYKWSNTSCFILVTAILALRLDKQRHLGTIYWLEWASFGFITIVRCFILPVYVSTIDRMLLVSTIWIRVIILLLSPYHMWLALPTKKTEHTEMV